MFQNLNISVNLKLIQSWFSLNSPVKKKWLKICNGRNGPWDTLQSKTVKDHIVRDMQQPHYR